MVQETETFNVEGICKTRTLRDIVSMIDDCRKNKAMGLVIGTPGTGKTTALHYAQRLFEREWGMQPGEKCQGMDFIVVTGSTVSGEKPRLFLETIAEAIGDDHMNYGYASHNLRAITGRLGSQDTSGVSVIVCDEAQKLGKAALEVLREIHDATGIGVVMIGNERFTRNFRREDMGQYAHIASRITRRLPKIDAVPEEDFTAICHHHGVTDDGAIRALRPYKAGSGGLRHVVAVIQTALKSIGGVGIIGPQNIADAAAIMGIEG